MPEWILVDRSAVVAERLVGAIWQYQQEHPGVKLAVHLAKRLTPAARRLAGFADLVFVEDEPVKTTAQVCHLGAEAVDAGDGGGKLGNGAGGHDDAPDDFFYDGGDGAGGLKPGRR